MSVFEWRARFQLNLSKIHQLKAQVDAEKESLLNVNVAVHSCVVVFTLGLR